MGPRARARVTTHGGGLGKYMARYERLCIAYKNMSNIIPNYLNIDRIGKSLKRYFATIKYLREFAPTLRRRVAPQLQTQAMPPHRRKLALNGVRYLRISNYLLGQL